MLIFYAKEDFFQEKNLFFEQEPFSFCILSGKSKKIKADIWKSVLRKAHEKSTAVFCIFALLEKDRPVGLYLPDCNRFLIDAQYFGILKSKDVPDGRNALFVFTDGCLARASEKRLAQIQQREQQKLEKAKDYKCAANAMAKHIETILMPTVCKGKMLHFVLRFISRSIGAARELTLKPMTYYGTVTGFSGWGAHTLYASFLKSNPTVYKIKDRFSVVAPILIKGLSAGFASYGYETKLFTSALTNMPIHLVVPELNLCFFTETPQERFPFPCKDTLSVGRFLPLHTMLDYLPEIKLYTILEEKFLDECVYALLEAEEDKIAAYTVAEAFLNENKLRAVTNFVLHFLDL